MEYEIDVQKLRECFAELETNYYRNIFRFTPEAEAEQFISRYFRSDFNIFTTANILHLIELEFPHLLKYWNKYSKMSVMK